VLLRHTTRGANVDVALHVWGREVSEWRVEDT
jgi:hypothetical protein